MVTAIAAAFGGVSGAGGESGLIYSGVNSMVGGFGLGTNPGDTRPSAFLNYILFDLNYKVVNAGWIVVPASASWSQQKISISDIAIKEAGYLFAYLSYEDQSNNYVYFDDFKVTHTKSRLIQGNEYYPFGMQTANSWTRESALGNNFLSNGGTELNSTTGFYDLVFRNYDPVLGRMMQVDPVSEKYLGLSPYHFSFNNPAYWSDPSGADPLTDLALRLFNGLKSGSRASYSGTEIKEMLGEGPGGGGSRGGQDGSYSGRSSWGPSLIGQDFWNIPGMFDWAFNKHFEYSRASISAGNGEVFDKSEWILVTGRLDEYAGQGFPLLMWVDPSSLNIKRIGDAWYGSAHIDEEMMALKLPNGVARVHLSTTVNFNFSALGFKKNVGQYLAATAMDRARASVWEELYTNPSMSNTTAEQEFKEYFGLHLFNLTYGSEVKSYTFPGVSTFEVQFQFFPSLPPR